MSTSEKRTGVVVHVVEVLVDEKTYKYSKVHQMKDLHLQVSTLTFACNNAIAQFSAYPCSAVAQVELLHWYLDVKWNVCE